MKRIIPLFPNFKKLTLHDKEEIKEYLHKYPPYADFNFLSMWSYNIKNDLIISSLNDNLVVRFRDYITSDLFYSFLGNNKVVETVEKLLERSRAEKLNQELKLIPESNIIKQEKLLQEYSVVEDNDNFEYIHSIAELSELRGGKYHTHRNFVNRFQALYPSHRVELLNIKDQKIQDQILNVFYVWEKRRNEKRQNTQHELIALKRALLDASDFTVVSVGIYVDNALRGFIIADLGHNKYSQSHFAKADMLYPQVYYMLYHHLAKQLRSMGYEFLNNEQDLGIPGLRKAKQQWNPIRYLKKYKIKRK